MFAINVRPFLVLLQIVTYETTKDGGIVEIMTETKSATPTAAPGGGGGTLPKPSVVAVTTKGAVAAASKKTSAPPPPPPHVAVRAAVASPSSAAAAGGHKSDAAAGARSDGGNKPNRRPLPKLIPIAEQQHKRSMVFRLPKLEPAAPSAGDDYYGNVAAGRSALSDFASLIDDQYDPAAAAAASNGANAAAAALVNGAAADRRRDGGGPAAGSGASPKSKTASFFDKLKAKVDETADLTCPVCRYESKCLSEFMRHQRTHDGYYADDEPHNDKTPAETSTSSTTTAASPPPPPPLLELQQHRQQRQQPPPVTAAELKSTRCQRCRKRCKTSAELVVHLATCRGLGDVSAAAAAVVASAVACVAANQRAAADATVDDDDDDRETLQHPMENKIFVWNTAVVSAPQEDEDDRQSITVTPVAADVTATAVEDSERPASEQRNDDEEEDDDDDEDLHNEYYPSAAMLLKQQQQQQQLHQHIIRKEGKMYKTVSTCPIIFLMKYERENYKDVRER